MKRLPSSLGFALLAGAALILAGCATPGYYTQPGYTATSYYGAEPAARFGTAESMQIVQVENDTGNPTGAILGAIVGGVVGNQFGHGRGRTLTTVGGAVAGGFAGNAIQHHADSRQLQEIGVRLDDGRWLQVRQPVVDGIYAGSRVRVTGYGSATRVFPAY